jgi:DNA-binding CsgD family transcriptional regulator
VTNDQVQAGARVELRGEESAVLPSIFRRSFVGSLRNSPRVLLRAGLDERRVREYQERLDVYFDQVQQKDQWWVNAQDPTLVGCIFMAGVSSPGPRSHDVHEWSCIAAHVGAAFRIRRQFADREQGARDPMALAAEAVLTPNGKVAHAAPVAQGDAARTALCNAVRAIDRARGTLRRSDPQRAVELWQAMVAGRWSLVDHFDSDGRRYVLAHRNDARVPEDARGLTLRERQVLAHVALGQSNKVIAYELGLSKSTIAGHLARARKKLHLPSMAALQTT